MAMVIFVTLFWVLPSIARWLLFPEEPPASDPPEGSAAYQISELERAAFEARKATGAEMRPILERTVVRLDAILRKVNRR